MKVAVLGAGTIGGYVGGRLAQGGLDVTLIGRRDAMDAITRDGLTLVALDGAQQRVPNLRLDATDDSAALARCDVVLLGVKLGDLRASLDIVQRLAPRDALVVTLQNGVDAIEEARAQLGASRVAPGMVSFNVLRSARGNELAQKTSGPLVLGGDDTRTRALVAALVRAGVAARSHHDMRGVMWSKLVYNLNNAINALSRLPLRRELADRGYRRVFAAAMAEGLAVARGLGVRARWLPPLMPHLAVRVLPMPNAVFTRVARAMIQIDPEARASMHDDLLRGRLTEVDALNGSVVRHGARVGVAAPVNAALVALVHEAERSGADYPPRSAAALAAAGGLSPRVSIHTRTEP